jgi:cytochrome b
MTLSNNQPSNQSNNQPIEQSPEPAYLRIWDLPVRIFHWLLVILCVAAYVTHALGTDYFIYHRWSGYAMLVLVSFRILWGFVGTYHARFSNFVRNPITTTKYAFSVFKKTDKHYAGHNPLGAIMVIVLLSALLVQAITGLFTNDEIFNLGPLYAYVSDELSLSLTSLHRQLFYWILGAILLHIAAVLFHQFLKHDKIISAMFTGKKSAKGLENEKSISSSKLWLAIILLAVLSLLLAWVVMSAPEAVSELDY